MVKNIYLIGMMGAGKSSTGEAVAKELSMRFVDMDEEIVKGAKMSINEIFESRGEPYFRKLEKEVLKQAAKRQGQVIATGGGAVLDPDNLQCMKETGTVVYLRATMETLWKRVQHKTDRPLLKAADPETVFGKLYHERRTVYESVHDFAVNTDGQNPQEAGRSVIQVLGLAKAS